jgi:Lysozyme like domain
MAASKWDLSNWQKGKPTLLQALGLNKGTVDYPKLTAQLPSAAATAQNTQNTSSDASSFTLEGPTGFTSGSIPADAQHFSQSQLQQIWIAAGGNPANSLIASAIAEAESSGYSGIVDNDANGTTDRGLWQINSTHGSQSTFNVIQNARAAIALSNNGVDWDPWSTYTSGDYEEYM